VNYAGVPGALVSERGFAHRAEARSEASGYAASPRCADPELGNGLYTLTHWPYIARGICPAFLQALRSGVGHVRGDALGYRLAVAYVVISGLSAAAAILGEATNSAAGYAFLGIGAASTYAVVALVVTLLHASETAASPQVSSGSGLWITAGVPLFIALFWVVPVALADVRYPFTLCMFSRSCRCR
jgi:hypothetical protein